VVKGVLGFYNYAYLWYRPDGAMSPEEIADTFFDVLINGLIAAPAPAPASDPDRDRPNARSEATS
jgi:hypothetical protein